MEFPFRSYGYNPDKANEAIDRTGNPAGVREQLATLDRLSNTLPREPHRDYSKRDIEGILAEIAHPVQRFFDSLRDLAGEKQVDWDLAYRRSQQVYMVAGRELGTAAVDAADNKTVEERYLDYDFVRSIAKKVANRVNPIKQRGRDKTTLDISTIVDKEALRGLTSVEMPSDEPNVHLLEILKYDPVYLGIRFVGEKGTRVASQGLVVDFKIWRQGQRTTPQYLDVACAAFLDKAPETRIRYVHASVRDCEERVLARPRKHQTVR